MADKSLDPNFNKYGELTSFDPTWRMQTRDVVANYLQNLGIASTRQAALDMAEGFTGSPDPTADFADSIGFLDFTPLGLAFGAQEIKRGFETAQNPADYAILGLSGALTAAEAVPLAKSVTTPTKKFLQGLSTKISESDVGPLMGERFEDAMSSMGALNRVVPPSKSQQEFDFGQQPKTESLIQAPTNEMGFYSPIEEASLNLKRKSGPPQSFINELANSPNVKKSDLDWMGLTDFFSDRKSVTREEIQDYIQNNKIKFTEQVYKATDDNEIDFIKAFGIFPELERMPNVQRVLSESLNDYTEMYPYVSERLFNDYGAYEELRDMFIQGKQKELRELAEAYPEDELDLGEQLEQYLEYDVDDEMQQYVNELENNVVDPVAELGLQKGPQYKEHTFEGGIDDTEIAFRASNQAIPKKYQNLDEFPANYKLKELDTGDENPVDDLGQPEKKYLVVDENDSPVTLTDSKGAVFDYKVYATTEDRAKKQFLAQYNADARQARSEITNPITFSHYDEDVIAHLRFNTRYAPDGKKVLLVEEIQSDWMQAGRDRGFTGSTDKDRKKYKKVKNKLNALANQEGKLVDELNEARELYDKTYSAYTAAFPNPNNADVVKSKEYNEYTDAFNSMNTLRSELEKLRVERESFKKKNKQLLDKSFTVKNAPESMKEGWYEAILNRVMKIAVDGDFDQIALTRGKDQIDRYEYPQGPIEKVRTNVGEILYRTKYEEDPATGELLEKFDIRGIQGGGRGTRPKDRYSNTTFTNLSYEQLERLVGKDAAQKMKNDFGSSADPKNYPNIDLNEEYKRILPEGDDVMQIGGRGMVNWYDQIYPKTLQRLASKYDAYMKDSPVYIEDDKYGGELTLPTIDVTPKMRYELAPKGKGGTGRGSPLFSAAPVIPFGVLSSLGEGENENLNVLP